MSPAGSRTAGSWAGAEAAGQGSGLARHEVCLELRGQGAGRNGVRSRDQDELGVALPTGALALSSQSRPGEGLEEEGQAPSQQLHLQPAAAWTYTWGPALSGQPRAPQAGPRAGSPAPRCPCQTLRAMLCPWAPLLPTQGRDAR